MTITDYASLKTEAAEWAWRTGDTEFTDRLDVILQMVGARFNRKLPDLRVMEEEAALTGTVDADTVSLPSDYIDPISLHLTTFGVLTKLSPSVPESMLRSTVASIPEAWAIDGTNILLNCPCNQAHTFKFRYRKSFTLDDTTTTNWLLTNHPDVYLAGVLVWGGLLQRDTEEATKWKALLEEGIAEIQQQASRSEGVATLKTDAALMMVRSGFNYNEG